MTDAVDLQPRTEEKGNLGEKLAGELGQVQLAMATPQRSKNIKPGQGPIWQPPGNLEFDASQG